MRKPISPEASISDFYKIKITDKCSGKYRLTDKEATRFGYSQTFLQNLKGVVLMPNSPNNDAAVNSILVGKYDTDLVFTHPGQGGAFGDSFGWISFICRLSEASGKRIKVARLHPKAILLGKELLNTTGVFEEVKTDNVFRLPGGTKGGYREVYSTLFLPAKTQWTFNQSKVVAVQFGKRGLADRRIQNPKDEERIVKALEDKGYTVKQIGGHLSNIECMELAASCQFFVGTCSGMSHLCHSVGTPVHMLTNNRSLERVSAGHVKNVRSPYPTIFWQTPKDFIDYVNTL
jgi:hypothetical protein